MTESEIKDELVRLAHAKYVADINVKRLVEQRAAKASPQYVFDLTSALDTQSRIQHQIDHYLNELYDAVAVGE